MPKEYYVRKLTDTTNEVDQLKTYIKTLETQLAQLNNKNNNNANGNQLTLENLLAEKEEWVERIDKIYDNIRIAQENYYSMSSKEKLLKLRTKYKENTEKNRKLFNMDGEFLKRVSTTYFFGFSIIQFILNFSFLFNQNESKCNK